MKHISNPYSNIDAMTADEIEMHECSTSILQFLSYIDVLQIVRRIQKLKDFIFHNAKNNYISSLE